jgi:hypothetical protein
VNVIIEIKGREAIPIRALPLLCEWGTLNPERLAGTLGRVTDDERHPLFGKLHGMTAYHVDDGTVHPVEEHHWRDHIYRNLQALSDTIKHTEITHETGHSEWRIKALAMLPKDAFVWKDEYALIYDEAYGVERRMKLSGDAHNAPLPSGRKPPIELNFNPFVGDDMQPLIQAALDAIRRAVYLGSMEQVSLPTVAILPLTSEVLAPAKTPTTQAPLIAATVMEQVSLPTVKILPITSEVLAPAKTPTTQAPLIAVTDTKPWLLIDQRDPKPAQRWYTSARYFARELVNGDSTLLVKKARLANLVSNSLGEARIFKRGGKKPPSAATVLKALANVTLA